MRVIYTLIALIIVLGWLGFELRGKYRDVGDVLLGTAGLLTLLLVAGMAGWI